MNWIKRNLWEIERSSALAWLGSLISLGYITLYFFWSSKSQLFSGAGAKPLLCWEFFPHCASKFPLSGQLVQILFTAFLITSILSVILHLIRRSFGLAWFFCTFSWGIAFLFYALDASLRSNILGFFLLLSFGYLFVPSKIKLVRYVTLVFYLVDAYTKLNADWLSGLPLYGSIAVPEKGLEWIAAFSVIIQIVMPFFLISRDGQRTGYGFAALFAYHIFHLYLQPDPGHLILALLLLFFVFDFFEFKRIQRETMYQSYEHPEPSQLWWPFLMALLLGSQLAYANGKFPLMLFQLEAPRGSVECKLMAYAHYRNKVEILSGQAQSKLPSNFRCHPMMNFNLVKNFCEDFKKDSEFDNVTAFFLTRSLSDESYAVRFSSDRFCDKSYTFTSQRDVQQ